MPLVVPPSRLHADLDPTNRQTAILVTVVTVLTLGLLSVAIFSLAATTRNLSVRAESLHHADEATRAATTVRAQLALAVHGARVDRELGSDSTDAINSSLDEARLALSTFESAVDLVVDRPGATSSTAALVERTDSFGAAARASLMSIEEVTGQDERDQLDAELQQEFGAVADVLVIERDALLDSVGTTDRRMATLGNLASFVVAFLVPSSAIFIYQQLARRPRRQLELEQALERDRLEQSANSQTVALLTHEMRSAIDDGRPALIVERAAELASAAGLIHGVHRYRLEFLPIGNLLGAVVQGTSGRTGHVTAEPSELFVMADRISLEAAVTALVNNVRTRAASRVRLQARPEASGLTIDVISDAAPLSDDIVRLAFIEPTGLADVAGDERLIDLVHARTLIEGMGGTVGVAPSDQPGTFFIHFASAQAPMPPTSAAPPTTPEGVVTAELAPTPVPAVPT